VKRRHLLQSGTLIMLLGARTLAGAATILAVRIWPAPDYSRVTIESDSALQFKQLFVASPPRLAVDIEGIELNAELKALVAKVGTDDPTIAGPQAGRGTTGVHLAPGGRLPAPTGV
jgi:N-acetylmuramoyl-L-alanine amidase